MKVIPNSVSRSVGRQQLILQKNAPHIAFGVGIVATVVGTYLSCKATLRSQPIVAKAKEELLDIRESREIGGSTVIDASSGRSVTAIEITDSEYRQAVAHVYMRTSGQLAKEYGPAFLAYATGIGLLTSAHITLTKRNAALAATLTALTKAFDEYRSRVRAEVGAERENELFLNAVEHTITDETGKEKKIKVLTDPNGLSPYAKVFDEYSRYWNKDPELNRLFVQAQQNYANDLLQVRGHVFLNEVYDQLGLERTKAGAVVGWIISEEGDNYIDFGIFNSDPNKTGFVNGWERSVWLDFNVDGVIYDKLG